MVRTAFGSVPVWERFSRRTVAQAGAVAEAASGATAMLEAAYINMNF